MKDEALRWFNIASISAPVIAFGGYPATWYELGDYVIYTEPNTPDTNVPGISLYLIQDIIDVYCHISDYEGDDLLEEMDSVEPEPLDINEHVIIRKGE